MILLVCLPLNLEVEQVGHGAAHKAKRDTHDDRWEQPVLWHVLSTGGSNPRQHQSTRQVRAQVGLSVVLGLGGLRLSAKQIAL